MKKIYLTLTLVAISIAVNAQTVLRYNTHGLVADHVNEMKITTYVDPGNAGKNVVWDFRELKLSNNFVGTLDHASLSKGAHIFPNTNTRLEEFGNSFFFRTTKKSIEQHGFISANGKMRIKYDKPFVKMRYPFTFGSSYTGTFNATYYSADNPYGDINGNYTVEGDGIGTLMLPGNMIYENALRVKEVKAYDQTLSNRSYKIETITYRWYVTEHRFPILVLIQSNTIYQDGRSFTSNQAAYNPIALNNVANPLAIEQPERLTALETYPNPYHDFVNIRFNLANDTHINLSVYDVTGKLVRVLYNGPEMAGDKHYQFSAKEINLSSGAYIVKLRVDGVETSSRIIEM